MAAAIEAKKKHPGERLATFFDNFFKTILSVSTLGASITFSKLVDAPTPPLHGPFSANAAQSYMGVSWLLFLLDLAATAFATCAFTLYRPQAIAYFGTENSDKRRVVMWYASVVSALLFGILVAAFLFLGLVVVSFAGWTGWAAVALSSFAGVLGGVCIVWQSPIGSKAIGGVGLSREGTGMDDYSGQQRIVSFQQQVQVLPEQGVAYVEDDKIDVRAYNDGDGYDAGGGTRKSYGEVERVVVARPIVAEVPGYLADMRRYRSSRSSRDTSYIAKF
ncbi:hypothetical protein LHYA1_G008018 [Lachnellula hyalina]|uniref:Uncharacterized protein n=1 Tax=Lachnellula hyalina TaxID=1316788 RepID=A0A8H8QW95_9HELO|nr:uncharacterized protein LHYA1_G008018 [Lachnellula hyalina]TVY23983.1 hypothetical protein LHYA1_G008018 [Lachnellula hyalina]